MDTKSSIYAPVIAVFFAFIHNISSFSVYVSQSKRFQEIFRFMYCKKVIRQPKVPVLPILAGQMDGKRDL
jgi:hypothetical protein